MFVPCVGKDDAVSTSASGALETPKRTPKAEGGGASAGKVAAALAPPAAVASQSTVAISSPSKSPSKQLNLDSLDIKVTKDVVQKHKSAKEARGGGASGYKLTVNLSLVWSQPQAEPKLWVSSTSQTGAMPLTGFLSLMFSLTLFKL